MTIYRLYMATAHSDTTNRTSPRIPTFSPRDYRCVVSRFFSVNMKASSQGNLLGRSLKGALATTTV
jgi:Tfp pilus assembly ATPase PilU